MWHHHKVNCHSKIKSVENQANKSRLLMILRFRVLSSENASLVKNVSGLYIRVHGKLVNFLEVVIQNKILFSKKISGLSCVAKLLKYDLMARFLVLLKIM